MKSLIVLCMLVLNSCSKEAYEIPADVHGFSITNINVPNIGIVGSTTTRLIAVFRITNNSLLTDTIGILIVGMLTENLRENELQNISIHVSDTAPRHHATMTQVSIRSNFATKLALQSGKSFDVRVFVDILSARGTLRATLSAYSAVHAKPLTIDPVFGPIIRIG